MNTCSGCPARWSGHRTAHCGSCHRTFSTVANFDRHRSPNGPHGACRFPGLVGLTQRDGVWSMPTDPANVERLRKLRANTVIQAVGDT